MYVGAGNQGTSGPMKEQEVPLTGEPSLQLSFDLL